MVADVGETRAMDNMDVTCPINDPRPADGCVGCPNSMGTCVGVANCGDIDTVAGIPGGDTGGVMIGGISGGVGAEGPA